MDKNDYLLERVKNLPVEERNKLNNYISNYYLSVNFNISKVNIIKFTYCEYGYAVKNFYKIMGLNLLDEEIKELNRFDVKEFENLLIYLLENNFIINKFIDETRK